METRVGPQLNSFTLTQAFPWFGTPELRGQVAVLEATALYHRYQEARRDVAAQVKEAYYDLGYVDAAIGLAREAQSLLEHYEALATARYATGQGLQQAVIKLQAEITRIVDRRHLLDRQRATLEAHLNTLLDRPPEEPVAAVPALARFAVELDREQLYRLGEEHRTGRLGVLELLDGERTLIDVRSMRARYLADLLIALTALERAIGTRVPRTGRTP